jgi:CheY-like chemotaxis protein
VGLAVADDGEGMDDETAARAFDPFFSTKREGEGTGLGLATVYGIVARAGGHIELRTRKGRGTTFDILLPAVGSPRVPVAAEPAAPAAAGPGHAGRTVLLVEDDTALRDTTVRVLAGGGHRVLQAADAEEALRVLSESSEHVDVVVSDVVLPGMSGVDLARRLEARADAPEIVLVSGYTDDVAMRSEGSGGRPVIDKPFTAEQLLDAVAGDGPPATVAATG